MGTYLANKYYALIFGEQSHKVRSILEHGQRDPLTI